MDESTRGKFAAEIETRSIPLRLGPLLASYRRAGLISIRVERLPHRARLSGGQNNGDHSWSVSLDELDNLAYLLPSDVSEAHTLAIRVINRDGGDGATLAVLDYQISPADAVPGPALESVQAPPGAASPNFDLEIRDLRAALTRAKAELSARESALAEVRQQAERDWAEKSRQLIDNTLIKARTDWDGEFAKRLAAVSDRAESMLDSRRQAWQAELDARLAESERRAQEQTAQARERWRREADAASASSQEVWKAGEAARLAAAEARWRKETATALAEAQAEAARNQVEHTELERLRAQLLTANATLASAQDVWKVGEVSRLAAAEARWRNETATALADASTEAARSQGDRAELVRLRDELATAARSLAGCEAELAKVRSEAEQAREGWRQGTETAISRAKKTWKAEEDARLASAQTQWREQTAEALGEAVARRERAEAALITARAQSKLPHGAQDDVELQRLHDEVATLKSAIDNQQTELALAREKWRQEIEAELAQAKGVWRTEETARHAAAEARWREQSAAALAEASAMRERAEAALVEAQAQTDSQLNERHQGELRLLQDEVATMRSTLEIREHEHAQAHERWQQEAAAQLAQAKEEWSSAETARLGEAESREVKEIARTLQDATGRYEMAEAELAAVRARPNSEAEGNDHVTILRLRDEQERMRIMLEVRDIELRQARSAAAEALDRWKEASQSVEPQIVERRWLRLDRSNKRDGEERTGRPLWRDVAIVACLAALGTVLYPTIVTLIPDDWSAQIGRTDGATRPLRGTTAVSEKPLSRPALPVWEKSADIVIRSANVHTDPSTASAVLAILPSGTKVTPIEQRGNWVLVPIIDIGGQTNHQQGWVYASFLKAMPDGQKPSAADQ